MYHYFVLIVIDQEEPPTDEGLALSSTGHVDIL